MATVVAGLLLAAPATAAPAADPDRGQPASDLPVEQLQAQGLGQSRGEPVPTPEWAYEGLDEVRATPRPVGAPSAILFVNFDGAQLTSGQDDSRANRTQISQLAGTYAPYGSGTKREATLQAVRTDWQDFNVAVVDQRPASGDYVMNMTGPDNAFGSGVLGIAPLDCDDRNPNNITYAFHSANDQFSPSTQATTISQEIAHSYGLEHVREPNDVMNPYNAGGDPSFIDRCISIDGGNLGIVCGAQHQRECGTQSQQNAYQELLTLFGPSTPDAGPPTAQITFPADGAVFEPGASFVITAEANDDRGVEQVQLFINGTSNQTRTAAPYDWSVDNIPAGEYTFTVTATDIAGNESESAPVRVSVTESGTPPDPTGGGSGTTTSGSGTTSGGSDPTGGSSSGSSGSGTSGDPSGGQVTSAGSTAGTGGDTDGGGLPPGFGGEDDDAAGCACTAGATPPLGAPAALGLLGLVFVAARRRRD
jgi:MYXO-CTERM domain-containing protein